MGQVSFDCSLGEAEVSRDLVSLKVSGDALQAETLLECERIVYGHDTSPNESVT